MPLAVRFRRSPIGHNARSFLNCTCATTVGVGLVGPDACR